MAAGAALAHILIVSPSLKAGGIERALTVLANAFVRRGLKVSFLVCLPGAAHYALDDEVVVYRSNIAYAKKADKGLFYLRLLGFIRRTTKKLNPQLVLSFGDVFNPLVLLALLGAKYPVFISDRTSPDFRINPLARFLKKRLYPRAAGMIAQTSRAAWAQRERYGKRLPIQVIPNAIKRVAGEAAPATSQRVLYVGRLSWEKGVDRLISAFGLLKNGADWQLDIVGEGPQAAELKALAKKLGVAKQVVFHGLVKDPIPFYLQAGVFVLPSHIEGFPNALCEAMSAGLPVVCFDTIPHESLFVSNESGIAVAADDVAALARALEDLIEQPGKRTEMGIKAKELSRQWRQEEIADNYLVFLSNVCGFSLAQPPSSNPQRPTT